MQSGRPATGTKRCEIEEDHQDSSSQSPAAQVLTIVQYAKEGESDRIPGFVTERARICELQNKKIELPVRY